jgi:hypothetical protein
LAIATEADIADGRIRRFYDLEKVKFEARILEATQDRQAVQADRKFLVLSRIASPKANAEVAKYPGWQI